jgi:transposase
MLSEPADPALPDDVATLQSLVTGLSAQVAGLSVQLNVRDRIIEALKAQLAALRRRHFGPQSERLGRLADQLELQIEEMEQNQVPAAPAAAAEVSQEPPPAARERPVRKPLPASLPREEEVLAPPYARCPSCGVALHRIGEDVSEVLEVVPARLRVRRYIRPVMTCRCCGDVSQAAPPPLPLAKSNAGASLLADIALAKYDDHLPAYRQAERFAREGLDLPRSTLTDWLGRTAVRLEPLIEAIAAHVFQADKLHADDTPVSVLAPGAGKTRTGRLWVYARDDRASGDATAPAVLYRYSPDRKGEHPQSHLAGWRGSLQADGDAGFFALDKGSVTTPAEIVEIACWAHTRRKFFDVWQASKGPAAKEVLDRIGLLYGVEEKIRGQPPDQRVAVRQAEAAPRIAELRTVLEDRLGRISGKSPLAGAIRYALARWTELTRYLDDGRLEIDNNIAERALRTIAIGRKNWLFAGSDAGGETAAAFYTVIETAKLNGHNPRVWLTRVLEVIGRDRGLTDYAALLPWVMPPEHTPA